MYVEIQNSVEELPFEDFSGGDLFVYNNETFMVLSDEIFDSGSRSRYNAINLEMGEPTFFTSNTKVVCPSEYTLTVKL